MQDNDNNNVCRLCLKLVRGANVGVINEVMREMLRLLLIKLDLDVSEHPLVCGTCSEVLDEIYLFKSKCLYTEDIISSQIETNSKVSLRDILIEIENKRNILIAEDEVVCRLCIKIPLNGSYKALGETGEGISFVRDMMQIHLPEVDLSIIEKPLICEVCHAQLKNYISFASNCMAFEEKIQLYCDHKKISGPVDLARVLQFTEDKALDLQDSLDKDLVVKQEHASVMVKEEKVQDAEDFILEDHLVDSRSVSEMYLKNEEIEIKSENDEMCEEMEDSVETVAANNSGKSGSLKRKRQIRKSPSKGRKYLSSADHMARYRGRNKTFACRECTFKTDRKLFLAQHMVRHKDKPEVIHKCENCEYMTRRKSNFNQHIMAVHRDPTEERKFKCDQCPYETNFKPYKYKHNLRHMNKSEVDMYKCANCEFETIRKDNLNRHMLTHRDPSAERKFKCDQCTYETDFKSSLRKHNLIHKDKSEVEMHKCVNCDYETKLKSYLIKHMVKHRDPRRERKFKCDKCSYETDFYADLRKHNLIHKDKSEVQMHKCGNCEFETRHISSLYRHMVKHRDTRAEKKFKCDQCPYATDYKPDFYNHNLRHRDKSEVGMYKCANCEYRTGRKGNLIRHMLTHRGPRAGRKFKCDQCSYETDFKSSLSKHNLIHKDQSEVEMHKCVNCEYMTRRKDNLNQHIIAVHRDPTEERKFKCDKCPFGTDIKCYLRAHNLRRHKNISGGGDAQV